MFSKIKRMMGIREEKNVPGVEVEPGFGRLFSKDERDQNYLMRSSLYSVDYFRQWYYYQTGPVLDQGTTPHCVGYAWRQWLSSSLMMTKTGPGATHIYQEAQKVDEWDGEAYAGTSVRAGAKVLKSMGHIESYVWATSIHDIIEWVCGGKGTVVLGTSWYLGMNAPDEDGFIWPTGRSMGGHAYLLVGWNRKEGKGRIVNSWGPTWGDKGRAWIREDVLIDLMAEHGEACSAIERKVT